MNVTCTNCSKILSIPEDIMTFQSVVCCPDCHKIVTTSYARAERLVGNVLSLYVESLRLALIKKQANLPKLPVGDMPIGDLAASMDMLRTLDANNATSGLRCTHENSSEGQQARRDKV